MSSHNATAKTAHENKPSTGAATVMSAGNGYIEYKAFLLCGRGCGQIATPTIR